MRTAATVTVLALCVSLTSGCSRSCGESDREIPAAKPDPEAGPPPALRLALPPMAEALPAPTPSESLASGVLPTYPTPIALTLADGVEVLSPPMRVQSVLPIEGRPLAVVSGLTADGPAIELVDIDRGVVRWRSMVCGAPAVHATVDRIICAGWRGLRGLSVDDGRSLWTSPLMFRAAHERYLLARDPEDDKTAAVLDGQTGKTVLQMLSPAGETFDEAKRLCSTARSFEVFSWSDTGALRRLRFARTKNSPSAGRVLWKRKLARPPAKVELCDPIPLLEVPIAGSALRKLHALSSKSGKDIAKPLPVRGWWRAPSGEGIETATGSGVQLRTRKLELTGSLLSEPVAGRLVASWGELRLVRSVAGTLALLDNQGLRAWMPAPARVDRVVMSGRRLLAGSWLSPPQTSADTALLYDLPARSGTPESPPPVARGPSAIPEPPPQRVPPRPSWKPRTYQKSGVGTYAVTHVHLDGETVFAVALEGRPTAKRGAGIAAFDLAKRSWSWHSADACPPRATVVGIAAAENVVVCAAVEHYPGPGHLWAIDRATGARVWRLELATVDRVQAAGSVIVAHVGSRIAVIDAASGKVGYELSSDNGHQARVALTRDGARTLVVAVEPGGVLVARDPSRGGELVWSRVVRGYVTRMLAHSAGVAVFLATGELLLVSPSGASNSVPARSSVWELPRGSDLVIDTPRATEGVSVLRAFDSSGSERFRTSLAITPPLRVVARRTAKAPILLLSHRGAGRLIVLSPGPGASAGRVRGSYHLPDGFVRGGVFSAVAGGKPVIGAVVAKPLGIALF